MTFVKWTRLSIGTLSGAIGLCWYAGAIAAAQSVSNSTDDSTQLSEIIVTATKREEKIRDVAMGATAITGAYLDTRQALSVEDIAPLVPGLSLQPQGNGFTRLIIRGENAGTSGSTVGVYVDDSPIGSSNGLVRGGLLTANISTWDLQRVEVLRGPQGTLYGASTEGGLIKYVAEAPDPGEFEAAVQLGGQSILKGHTGESYKGVLNVPIIRDKAALRVSATYEDLPGYIDDPSRGVHGLDGGWRKVFRGSFLYNLTEDLSIRLTGFYQETSTGGLPYENAVGAALTYAAPPYNQFAPSIGDLRQTRYAGEPLDNRIANDAALIRWNLGGITATSITSYGSINQQDVEDYTSAEVGPGFTYGDVLTNFFFNGAKAGLAAQDYLRVQKTSEEFRLTSNGLSALQWQAGGFYTRERAFVSDAYNGFLIPTNNPFNGGTDFGTQSLPSEYEETAGFGELTYHLNASFDAALGARYAANHQSSTTLGTASALLGPALDIPTDSRGHATTYSFAPRWHLNPDTMVYARVASGYRPGGPNVVPPGAPAGVPRTYESDKTTNYELGFRSDFLDKLLYVDVDAFYIDWRDIQVFEVANAQGFTANAGGARSDGVEWNVQFNPIAGLSLNWVGAYTDAVITREAAAAGALKGERLPFVPKISTSLDTQYQWPVAADTSAFVGGTVAYLGSRYTDFGASAVFEPHVELPAYTTLALRGGVSWKTLQLELYGKNVTDKRGITGYANAAAPNLAGSVGIIQPATIGVLVTGKFH